MISRLMLNLRLHSEEGLSPPTGASTTLYERPISTVVEPYYPSNFALSHISTLDDGRIGDNGVYRPVDGLLPLIVIPRHSS
jgi:hypothetical protein